MGKLAQFLLSLGNLVRTGGIKKIEDAFKFAKNEFGEVTPLLKKQIERVFSRGKKQEPGTRKQEKDNVFTLVPKDKLSPAKMEEEGLGLESLKNPKRPGGPLDPTIGITRALARKILDRRGIEIGKKDPIDVFTDTFGEAINDVNNLAEEMIEIDARGGGMKDMDQMLEIEGLFDIEIPKNPQKGLTDDELLELMKKNEEEKILKDFDPEDRKPNAEGGLNYLMGM